MYIFETNQNWMDIFRSLSNCNLELSSVTSVWVKEGKIASRNHLMTFNVCDISESLKILKLLLNFEMKNYQAPLSNFHLKSLILQFCKMTDSLALPDLEASFPFSSGGRSLKFKSISNTKCYLRFTFLTRWINYFFLPFMRRMFYSKFWQKLPVTVYWLYWLPAQKPQDKWGYFSILYTKV